MDTENVVRPVLKPGDTITWLREDSMHATVQQTQHVEGVMFLGDEDPCDATAASDPSMGRCVISGLASNRVYIYAFCKDLTSKYNEPSCDALFIGQINVRLPEVGHERPEVPTERFVALSGTGEVNPVIVAGDTLFFRGRDRGRFRVEFDGQKASLCHIPGNKVISSECFTAPSGDQSISHIEYTCHERDCVDPYLHVVSSKPPFAPIPEPVNDSVLATFLKWTEGTFRWIDRGLHHYIDRT